MHLHFSPKIRLLGAAPNPLARAAALPCQTLHRWDGYAPLRALNTRDLTGWEKVCSQRPAGRAAAPLGVLKKAATGGLFPGFGFPVPNKRFAGRWNWDSRRA